MQFLSEMLMKFIQMVHPLCIYEQITVKLLLIRPWGYFLIFLHLIIPTSIRRTVLSKSPLFALLFKDGLFKSKDTQYNYICKPKNNIFSILVKSAIDSLSE